VRIAASVASRHNILQGESLLVWLGSHSLGFLYFFRENEWDEEQRLALDPLFVELR
jgi:hypothetical protein